MAEEEENEGGEAPKGGKKKLIIIIVIVLVLIGGGVGAFLAFAGGGGGGDEDEDGEDDEFSEEVEEGELPGAIVPLDAFVVNLQIKGSFLKTAIQLEFIDPEPPPMLENDMPKVRDAVIRVLSNRKAGDLLGMDGKDKLRDELRDAVNEALGIDDVVYVYFTEFIIQ